MVDTYLQCIWTFQRMGDTLPKPGIQTLMNFSLKLKRNITVRQVNRFIRGGRDCVLEVITKDLNPHHTEKMHSDYCISIPRT